MMDKVIYSLYDYYVYGLCYPSGRIFYIGKGRGDRAARHLQYRVHNAHVARVIYEIQDSGKQVRIKKIATGLSNKEACAEERRLIKKYGYLLTGGRLLNLHPGGQGGRPSETWTDEQRARMSRQRKGNTLSTETRARMSKALLGNQRLLGHTHSVETKVKISVSSRGRKLSPEARAKISAAKQGDKNPMYGKPSPRLGVTLSDETKQKLRTARLDYLRRLQSGN